jgi:beta-glucosidase
MADRSEGGAFGAVRPASDPAASESAASDPVESALDARLAEMSLEEKVSLLSGSDVWGVPGLPRHGIPSLVMSDGPSGVRGATFLEGRAASFPCETALAASWDPELVRTVGRALGREARRVGAHVLLAPTANLHRHPLGGRNFECFSEDPLLSAVMVQAYVDGVQSEGVACCVKHLVGNDSEFERHTISTEVDEATLRESYLVPFEAAVSAGVWAVMAAYNKVNGVHASEHPFLLDQVLRQEWGFDGVVVSDWFATHTTEAALVAGLDIEMPGPPRYRGQALVDAVRSGAVDEWAVDRSARRVLRLVARTAGGLAEPDGASASGMDTIGLIRTAAARGMVLLKNDGVLPLAPGGIRTVALVGPGADTGEWQGGGSAHVNAGAVDGILPALIDALGPGVDVRFERGCAVADWPRPLQPPLVTTPDGLPGIAVEYLARSAPGGHPLATEVAGWFHLVWIGRMVDDVANTEVAVRARATLQPADSGVHEVCVSGSGAVRLSVDGAVVAEGRWDGPTGPTAFAVPGQGLRARVDLDPGRPVELLVEFMPVPEGGVSDLTVAIVPPTSPDHLERAAAVAREADAVVVVAQSPPGWESEGHDRATMVLPGDQDQLIERVAAANANVVVVVNSGAPVAMPWVDRVPAVLQMWFPGQELGPALADVLTGAVNPSGKLPTTFPRRVEDAASSPNYPGSDGKVRYAERSAFGYRAGDAVPRPLFPFGHGLSYSTYSLGRPAVSVVGTEEAARYEVVVPVIHSGGPDGAEVVQLYVESDEPGRPALELKAFCRVEVERGKTVPARLVVARRSLRRWEDRGWRLPAGSVRARIGTSSADLPITVDLPVPR